MVRAKQKARRRKRVGLDPKPKKAPGDPAVGILVHKEDNNLIGHENRQLKGMRDICQYVGFSESTVLGWIRSAAFPAKKTAGAGGIWVSSTNQVDQWRGLFFNA